MAISTFDQLKTAIAAWTHRADLTSQLSDFVALGEKRLFGELKVKEMETRADFTPTTRYLSTPARMTAIRRLVAKSSPPVECMGTSPDGIHAVYDSGSGTPSHYAILGSEIEFNRVPNVDVEIVYYAEPAALSDSATTNDVLTAYPDAYLASCMIEAAMFVRDTEMLATWSTLYQTAIDRANKKSSRFHTAGPLAIVSA